jgi:RNA polymerase sigma factor (sigma-70 family)
MIISMNDPGGDKNRDRVGLEPRRFETTCWTMVLSARDGKSTEARAALAELCATYWYPLYAFVRRKGYDAETAQDLVQGFFARLLEKGDLAAVEQDKGKFRSFLMAACSHFLANQADHDRAQKRGGGHAPISIDRLTAEGRYRREPAHSLTAERLFERQWALTLLENVLEVMKNEMARAGKERQFEALRPSLLGLAKRTPYSQIAAEMGVKEEAARAAAHRLRSRYRKLLCEEVARTVDDPAEVDAEIRSLLRSLGD